MAKRSMFVGMDVHNESIDVELVRPQLARRLARSAADLFVQTPARYPHRLRVIHDSPREAPLCSNSHTV